MLAYRPVALLILSLCQYGDGFSNPRLGLLASFLPSLQRLPPSRRECLLGSSSTLQLAPRQHSRAHFPVLRCCSSAVALPAPEPASAAASPRRQYRPVGPAGTDTAAVEANGLRLVSYNVLGPMQALGEKHNYTEARFRSWAYRRRLILDELASYNADIICLQVRARRARTHRTHALACALARTHALQADARCWRRL